MIEDIFCKIIKGEIKADSVYKDEDFWVIKDINPKAPVHLLVVPVKHIDCIGDIGKEDALLLGKGLMLAHKVAVDAGISEKGYRLIINEGQDGGKLVPHLHIHVLGGKNLGSKLVKE